MPRFEPAPLEAARRELEGKRVAVLGLAREGIDLARFLARRGADVTVVDRKSADQLGPELAQLEGVDVRLALGDDGGFALDGFSTLFASPGVPPEHPLIVGAHQQGVAVSSLVELLFRLCPAPIVGITGSAGKTTTTTLVGKMFQAAGEEVFVGGNIGRPLLGELERMTPQSRVVLELSSFQLEFMRQSPHVATITNVTPNHLDRHLTMEAYWAAKGQILNHQGADDWAVLNADDPWSRKYQPKGQVRRFSLEDVNADATLDGTTLVLDGAPLLEANEIPLRGKHNVANVLCAALTASVSGVPRAAMIETARQFRGVAHRLEIVTEHAGVRYVNDSIATSPERSIAALRSYDEPVVLIAGGRDKHLPMEEWAQTIGRTCRHVVLMGEMDGLVQRALEAARVNVPTSRARDMAEAVAQAKAAAQPGDVVLLSPGGTSYDAYRDFEERGRDFARWARALSGEGLGT